jgi:ribosome-associated protein
LPFAISTPRCVRRSRRRSPTCASAALPSHHRPSPPPHRTAPAPTPRRNALPELDLAALVVDAAEDKKGEDISVLDLTGRTIVADSFVIVTGRSTIQTRSIADAIVEKAKEAGLRPRTEGHADGGWILIDLGHVVAHVFTPEQRQFYNLERLWGRVAEARAEAQ